MEEQEKKHTEPQNEGSIENKSQQERKSGEETSEEKVVDVTKEGSESEEIISVEGKDTSQDTPANETEEAITPDTEPAATVEPKEDKTEESIESTEAKPTEIKTGEEEVEIPEAKETVGATTEESPSEISSDATSAKAEEDKKEDEEKVDVPIAEVEQREESADDEETEKSEEKTPAVEAVEKTPVVEAVEETADAPKEGETADSEEEEEEHEHELDYHGYSKKQMVQVVESLLKADNMAQLNKVLKVIKTAFDEVYEAEKKEALQAFIDDGNEEDDFEYRHLDLDNRFFEAYNTLKERKNSYFKQKEVEKESNLERKQAILERLRTIIDADETTGSINDIKKIQAEWKEIGSVPSQHNKSLWANYNALMDRYYDNRSIYYELKELDRKKNLTSKLEICEKAEALDSEENIKEAIKQLNELHDEFKHIGPVPREEQEAVWKRFKSASDAIYAKRKEFFGQLKKDLSVNLVAKQALVEKIQPYSHFDSEKITDWNAKTKEVLEIQKEWEAIGGLPKEHAKKINKDFWSAFKGFFNNKGQFFRKLEKHRAENLEKKKELAAKAEELKESDDFVKTAEALKQLQRDWKEIGPVPEKFRNEVYQQFKDACDHFFNRKRASSNEIEGEYEENLKKKKQICAGITELADKGEVDAEKLWDMIDEFSGIGFVPKKEIKNIQKELQQAIEKAVEKADIDDTEKHKLKYSAQFSKIKQGPNSERIIQKKENALKRQISNLESDIDLWKNNLSFFAASKNADKLKEEFNEKIKNAELQLIELKEKLRAITDI